MFAVVWTCYTGIIIRVTGKGYEEMSTLNIKTNNEEVFIEDHNANSESAMIGGTTACIKREDTSWRDSGIQIMYFRHRSNISLRVIGSIRMRLNYRSSLNSGNSTLFCLTAIMTLSK